MHDPFTGIANNFKYYAYWAARLFRPLLGPAAPAASPPFFVDSARRTVTQDGDSQTSAPDRQGRRSPMSLLSALGSDPSFPEP
ncbi:hypothetical protein CEXT_335131 [Caerostris extrusa]|uniref:Uncharacterized protein n=1 Tax=Caerostris extrusa TaxID=172846 RepID=A0AAV4P685_CAEEX|nr:hypothetical protein CEXT_335131 [Caerostris extrusa]